MTSQLKPVRVPFWGPLTAQVHGIYRRAFPPNEQISLAFLHVSSLRPGAQFLAWIDPKQPTSVDGVPRVVAMTYSQRAHGLLYLAFLAVNDQLRSAGYGSRVLNAICEHNRDLPVFLEIEPVDEPGVPNPHQRQRRLRFYEKNGFELTNMLTEESGDTYRVLRRGAQAAKVSPKQLQRALNSMGLGVVRSRVSTD
jgi:hypothetical protein